MASVTVDMEPGSFSVKGESVGEKKARKLAQVDPVLYEELRRLEGRKHKLAKERGPWKDATAKQRAAAKEVAAGIADVKARLVARAHERKLREIEKQAAAAKREHKMNGKS